METNHETKPEVKIIYVYSSYTPKTKASIYKYREKPENRERMRIKNRESYLKRMENPEYRERMNKESQARYRRKKEKKVALKLEESNKIIV